MFDTIYFYITLLCSGSYDVNTEEPLCARVVTNFLEVATRLFADFDDVAHDMKWFTSIDISDPDQLMLLTCSVQGFVQISNLFVTMAWDLVWLGFGTVNPNFI